MIRHTLVAGLAVGFLWASARPTAAQEPMGGVSPQTQKINELIRKGYESAGITKPAEKATDLEFMRRVFVDLQGRIPTVEEIKDFEADKTPNKRVKLVQRLLNEKAYTPKVNGKAVTEAEGLKKVPINYVYGYAANFADIWSVWLITRSGVDDVYRNQLEQWLSEQFENNTPYRDFVTALITASGKSQDNGAVNFIFRHLGDPIMAETKGAGVNFGRDGRFDNVPVTSRVTKMFLGIQTQCTQCHDHPQAKEWKQRDFWGVNAFFRQTDKRGLQTAMGKKAAPVGNSVELTDMPEWNRDGTVFYDQRDGQRKAVFATMLKDVAQAEKDQKSTKTLNSAGSLGTKTRRQLLAEWVLAHDNFEKAAVNRMWGHFFGRGLHKEPTVDDFKSDNEVVHPELLEYLAAEFKKYNHDMKKLLEWICTSDAYNLSHVAGTTKVKVGDKTKALTDVDFDPYFARMPLKGMSPDVLFESLAVATRARTRLADDAYTTLKRTWSSQLVKNFGDDEGNEANFNGTILQALMMMNGKTLNDQIKSDRTKGIIYDLVKKHSKGTAIQYDLITDELFMMTVSRHATKAELDKINQVRGGGARINLGTGGAPSTGSTGGTGAPPKGPPQKGPTPGAGTPVPGVNGNDGNAVVGFYEDVFWALLNTNEFMLNH
jgi:hypothetical protein